VNPYIHLIYAGIIVAILGGGAWWLHERDMRYEQVGIQKQVAVEKAAAKKRFLKRIRKTDRFTPKGGQNFRFNKDRTKKIPTPPPDKKNFTYKKKTFTKPVKIKPVENKGN
jgi:hypothetical protein